MGGHAMKAEIIAVGTELLLGQIVNTNAQFLSQELALMGIDVYFQTVVGDNEGRLMEAFKLASSRADLIVCTGGIGPTQDDLTKDVLAKYLNRNIVMHEPSLAKITAFFETRGTHMVESNKRQALLLEGSDPLFNETGMAVGIGLSQADNHYIVLPGPPSEMRPMFKNYAKPWLLGVMQENTPLRSKMLMFGGIGESTLEDRLIDLIQAQTDPTIAPYAKEGEVAIRLTTRAATEEEANLRFEKVETEIRARIGEHLYAEKEASLESAILELLTARGATFAAAESCSGGRLSDLVTALPGSSAVFKGGLVCYTNEVKHRLLGVPMEVLEGADAPGAVSAETAELLARGTLQATGADYAVSITGVAGPASSEGKPVGLVYVGYADIHGNTHVQKTHAYGNRDTIKLRSAKSALYLLWKMLKQTKD